MHDRDPREQLPRPVTACGSHRTLDRKLPFRFVVLALCGYDIARARHDYELLGQFPAFDSTPAAQTSKIYVVNASAYFSRPGPRIVDSLEILAGILHPDEFPEFVSHGPDDPRVVRVD